jgi:hypothetical protein
MKELLIERYPDEGLATYGTYSAKSFHYNDHHCGAILYGFRVSVNPLLLYIK